MPVSTPVLLPAACKDLHVQAAAAVASIDVHIIIAPSH